jgi:hypothetical protein
MSALKNGPSGAIFMLTIFDSLIYGLLYTRL